MHEIDRQTVKHVALLARLYLNETELKQYSGQLTAILSYINKLNEIPTENVPPTSHALSALKNVFRKDAPRPSLTAKDALRNAPSEEKGFFKVPQVIEGR